MGITKGHSVRVDPYRINDITKRVLRKNIIDLNQIGLVREVSRIGIALVVYPNGYAIKFLASELILMGKDSKQSNHPLTKIFL